MLYVALICIQLVVTVIMGVFFARQLRAQGAQPALNRSGSGREMDKLNRLRAVSLTRPLSEQVRPRALNDIVGQEDAVRALKAVLFGPNPQHVILYGPPGVGKTCAARLVLDAAKRSPGTPFRENAPFIEMDATCVRFDERAIADPLIGSVHDPIYQGAGQLGINGVPQPKEGAVTRAHGGVLFLDEIGELHPIQMNKLLKVLEDRLVRFESAYYNPDDAGTPRCIHEIFQHGLPADFRLVGATTRAPEELPPALRSRCMEVFFRPLDTDELAQIALGAADKAGFALPEDVASLIGAHSAGGRDAVNMVQMAAALAREDARQDIRVSDARWVIESGRYAPRAEPPRNRVPRPGLVNGLAVYGAGLGAVMEIEAVAEEGRGRVTVTGIVEEEEMEAGGGRRLRRGSMAKNAAQNVRTCLRSMNSRMGRRDIHINFPGGAPVDGPSAGVAMAVAAYSALTGAPVAADIAMTGELSVFGRVLPVGGVSAKLRAAEKAGLRRALIPAANDSDALRALGIEVIPVETLSQALALALGGTDGSRATPPESAVTLAAESARS